MTEDDAVTPAEVGAEAPRPADARLHPAWIWIGLGLALIARVLSSGRPGRTPDLLIVALLLPPFAILARWTYTRDSGSARFRVLRAALFAFLVTEAFYWGFRIGGAAAAIGAYMIFTRFIRPQRPAAPE